MSQGGGNVAPPLLDEDDEELLDDVGSPLLLDELELEDDGRWLPESVSSSSPVAPAFGTSSNEMRNVHPTTHVVKAAPRTSASVGRMLRILPQWVPRSITTRAISFALPCKST